MFKSLSLSLYLSLSVVMSFKKLEEYEQARDALRSLLQKYKKIQDEELAVYKKRISCELEFKEIEQTLQRKHYETAHLESVERNIDRELSKIKQKEYISSSKPIDSKIRISKLVSSTDAAAAGSIDHPCSSSSSSKVANLSASTTTSASTTSSSNIKKGVNFAISPLLIKKQKDEIDTFSKETAKQDDGHTTERGRESKNNREEKPAATTRPKMKSILSRLFSCSSNK